MDDQHLAGALLWFFGEAGDIPFLVAAMVAWIRADNREAARLDRALDDAAALDNAVRAQASGPSAARPDVAGPGADGSGGDAACEVPMTPDSAGRPRFCRPWWETDASVFGEDRARRYGWRPAPATGDSPPYDKEHDDRSAEHRPE
jgi:hypothetical protein